MAKHLRHEPGSVGEYFLDGRLVKTVYHVGCAHCDRGTEFASKRQMMEHVEICRGCFRLICLDCYGKPCRPKEMEAERIEREAELRARLEVSTWRCY